MEEEGDAMPAMMWFISGVYLDGDPSYTEDTKFSRSYSWVDSYVDIFGSVSMSERQYHSYLAFDDTPMLSNAGESRE